MQPKVFSFCCVLLFQSVLFSCTTPRKQNGIRSIELMRVGSWDDKGAIVSIDSTLTFRYLDRNKKQNYIGAIDTTMWDAMSKRLENIKFRTTQFPAHNNCKDCPTFDLIVKWKNKEKKIFRAENDPQDSLLGVLRLIDTSYKFVKLKAVDTPFKFEMKYPVLSNFDIKDVKFPPPLPHQH